MLPRNKHKNHCLLLLALSTFGLHAATDTDTTTSSIVQAQFLTPPQSPTIELLTNVPASGSTAKTGTTEKPVIVSSNSPFPSVKEQTNTKWDSGSAFANRPKPALGVWEPGDVPGTEIMRVSDQSGNGLHYYNSRQFWNSDMSKVMVGDGYMDDNRILDVNSHYSLNSTRIPLSAERVWSNSNPSLIYGMVWPGERFVSFNVDTGVTTTLYTRPGSTLSIRSKGNLSGDDSRIAFYESSTKKIISFDIKTRTVLGELVWPHGSLDTGGGYISVDWSGKWITVALGTSDTSIYRLNEDLTGLVVADIGRGHSDLAYDVNGQSVQVTTRGQGSVRVTNFDDTSKNYVSPVFGGGDPSQSLGSTFTPDYISGRGQNGAPGWVAFGGEAFEGSANHPIGMYKIDGNTVTATIKVIGWDHHSGAGYVSAGGNDDRQKPTVSPDGNSVAFTSDWGVRYGPISTYVIRDNSSK